jgi:hypothetical protein
MFEDVREILALKESFKPGRTSKLSFTRCTDKSTASISTTHMPDICYNASGCCIGNSASLPGKTASLDAPISSSATADVVDQLDRKVTLPYWSDWVQPVEA